MQQYLDLLQTIKEKGTIKEEARKGMPGTISLFGYQFRHNLKDGFPLLTTKKLSWKYRNLLHVVGGFLMGAFLPLLFAWYVSLCIVFAFDKLS